ncbi:uncharacterized protein LOC144162114 [Haemaphysalis longicornis]
MEDDTTDVEKVSLPFSSVLKFIDKQFETSRLLTEGEAVFEAKHVVVCSVKERGAKDVTLAALVLQSSGLNKDPHELQVTIEGRDVAAASCTCKAGFGRIRPALRHRTIRYHAYVCGQPTTVDTFTK